MVSGPEISHWLNTREKKIIEDQFTNHHENTHSFENRFRRNITSFKEVLEIEGNSFLETKDILITLITKVILTAEASQSVHRAKKLY